MDLLNGGKCRWCVYEVPEWMMRVGCLTPAASLMAQHWKSGHGMRSVTLWQCGLCGFRSSATVTRDSLSDIAAHLVDAHDGSREISTYDAVVAVQPQDEE